MIPRNAPGALAIHGESHAISGMAGRLPSATARETRRATASPYAAAPAAGSVVVAAVAARTPAAPSAPFRSSRACVAASAARPGGVNASAPYCHQPSCLKVCCLASAPTACATATMGGSKIHAPRTPRKRSSPATPDHPARNQGGDASISSGSTQASRGVSKVSSVTDAVSSRVENTSTFDDETFDEPSFAFASAYPGTSAPTHRNFAPRA